MAENDFYNPVNKPRDFVRSRGVRVAAELDRVRDGFGALPSKNQISSAAQLGAAEATASARNVYVLTSAYPLTKLEKYAVVRWFVANTNDATSTADVDGTGVKDIKNINGADLVGGELPANWPAEMIFDGDKWLLLNSALAVIVTIVFDEAISSQSFQLNEAITAFTLPTASGGSSPYTYAVAGLSTGLAFDATTRQVSGTPSALGDSTVTYTVTDANSNQLSVLFVIRVVATVLTIPALSAQTMTEGLSYNIILPVATGGTSPRTYFASGFPDGLEFDAASRMLSGSPSETGVFTVTYRVTDSSSTPQIGEATFEITVNSSSELSLPEVDDRSFVPNEAITAFTLPAATGGRLPYLYIVTGLPDGLEFDEDSRQVSGEPTTAETGHVTYRVRDDADNHVDQEFEIEISPAGKRWIAVVDGEDTVTAAQVEAGNSYGPTEQELAGPEWTGNKYIIILQPESADDLTTISLAGLGNSLPDDFSKLSQTVVVDGVTLEIWRSVDPQGDSISGEIWEVRP